MINWHLIHSFALTMTEEELIKECIEGSPLAQKALFEKFSGKMMTVCMRYASDRELAEDLLQDGFIKVFSNLVRFEAKGSFEGWVRRTMVNTCLDHIRRQKKSFADVDISEAEYLVGDAEKAFGKLRAEELMKLIEAMPTGYRTVFNLYVIEGYSHQEIADELGVTESTSKTQFKKARNYLMNVIGDKENI